MTTSNDLQFREAAMIGVRASVELARLIGIVLLILVPPLIVLEGFIIAATYGAGWLDRIL